MLFDADNVQYFSDKPRRIFKALTQDCLCKPTRNLLLLPLGEMLAAFINDVQNGYYDEFQEELMQGPEEEDQYFDAPYEKPSMSVSP